MRARVLTTVAVFTVLTGSGCATDETGITGPRCRADQRLAIVAQSVPSAAYVPCVSTRLPAGWRVARFRVDSDGTDLELRSDRAEQPVRVRFRQACSTSGATPVAPRDEGVRTSTRLASISPRYVGTTFDVFPGGCVTYAFDFRRGPHIALADELDQSLGLYARRELRRRLHDQLGVDL